MLQRLTKTQRGGGCYCHSSWSTLHPVTLPDPYSPLLPPYENCRVCTQHRVPLWKGGVVLPTFKSAFASEWRCGSLKPSNLQTMPPVPLQRKAPCATMGKGARNYSRSGENTPLPPRLSYKDVSGHRGQPRSWSHSQSSAWQSSNLDRSAGWLSLSRQRVGKAGRSDRASALSWGRPRLKSRSPSTSLQAGSERGLDWLVTHYNAPVITHPSACSATLRTPRRTPRKFS